MKKFLIIYHSPKEAMEEFGTMLQEDIDAVMAQWESWREKNQNHVIDFGNPVGAQTIISPSGIESASDDVSGYGIIQAESLEEAQKILVDHPIILDNDGSTISLYDIHEM